MKLIKRHIHLYFINPSNWIVSLLSVAVILSLYFLFIKEFTMDALTEVHANKNAMELFVDLLMVSGLLVVISATSCLPICSIFVKDKESGVMKDFLVSPLSKTSIHFSYVIAATMISILITLLSFIFILLFFHYQYHFHLSFQKLIWMIELISLTSFLSALILFSFSFCFQSMTSFSSFGNLFGVMIGFLTGVYIPIGYYPSAIQNGLFLFPLSQTTSLMRQVMSDASLEKVSQGISKVQETIQSMFGLQVELFNHSLTNLQQCFYLMAIVFFISLFIWIVSKIK